MVDVSVPHVGPNDPIPPFPLEPLQNIPLCELPQSLAGRHAKQQIVFIVARDRSAVFSLFRKGPAAIIVTVQ
jgi:hypothetical protein